MRYPVPLRYCLFCHVSFISFTKICLRCLPLGNMVISYRRRHGREKGYLFARKISLPKIPFIHLCHFFWDEGSPKNAQRLSMTPCCFRWTTLRPSDLAPFKSCLSWLVFATPLTNKSHQSIMSWRAWKGPLTTGGFLHVHFKHLWCLSNGICLFRQRTKKMINKHL